MAVLIVAATIGLPTSPATGQQASVVPTQWIAKQFTELLGRTPSTTEWNSWHSYYGANGCTVTSLKDKSRALLLGSEFAGRYPSTDKGSRVVALVRAVYNHEPNSNDWNALYAPYAAGSKTWSQTVDSVFNVVFAAWVVPGVCSASSPGYGFGASPPLDVKQLIGQGASRSQATLQGQLTAAAAACGTVSLATNERVLVGGSANGNKLLSVPPCVTLTTAGSPSVGSYARQGRLVVAGLTCVSFICNDTAAVTLGAGAELRNVWVDARAAEVGRKTTAVQLEGSSAADPGVIDNVRVTDPGAGGSGIRSMGKGTSGVACTDAQLTNNVVTGYARSHELDRAGRAMWADGVAVHCEQAVVQSNQIVDVGDWGIGLFGVWNRDSGMTAQRSTVSGNVVLSAGTPGSVAIGLDAAGLCLPERNGLAVPCIDSAVERSFAGTTVSSNTFWTSSRTSFDVGLMVGGKTLWGDHASYGRGAVVQNNTTGTASARVNVGIAVSGMYDTTLTGNTGSGGAPGAFTLVDSIGDVGGDLAGCPLVAVGDTRPWVASLTAGSQPSTSIVLYGCLLAPFPTGGLERIATSTAGNGTFVGQSTGLTFTPWGHNYGPAQGPGGATRLMDDIWLTPSGFAEVVSDFRELQLMGANTIRIHPQLNKFMSDPTTLVPAAFDRLERLAAVAEKLGIYLDVTGLGAWRKTDNNLPDTDPAPDADDWLSSPNEELRWHAQEIWWQETARRLKDRTSIVYFNLMNEMVAVTTSEWCGSDFAGSGLCFVQTVSLDLAGRTQSQVLRSWITRMRAAIAAGDPTPPTTASNLLFNNAAVTGDLDDATMVHTYVRYDDPATSVDEGAADINAIKAKKVAGKPMVLEEFFYLLDVQNSGCPDGDAECEYRVLQEGLERTINESRPEANGWIGHARGSTLAQGPQGNVTSDLFVAWMRLFQRNTPIIAPCGACQPN